MVFALLFLILVATAFAMMAVFLFTSFAAFGSMLGFALLFVFFAGSFTIS